MLYGMIACGLTHVCLSLLCFKKQVLDATSDEPWGPHGSALSELAHATKKL